MGFYLDKLQGYREVDTRLTSIEMADNLKSSLENRLEREQAKLVDNYHKAQLIGAGYHVSPVTIARVNAEIYQDRLTQNIASLQRVKSASPEEVVFDVIEREGKALRQYTEHSCGNYADAIDQLRRLDANKGIVNKARTLLGKREEARQDIEESMNLFNEQITVGQQASEEWQNMATEEKAEYVLGRFQFEGKTELDQTGLDELAYKAMQQKVEASQNEQTTGETVSEDNCQ